MTRHVISDELWKLLLERDGHACLNCLSENDLTPAHLQSIGSAVEEWNNPDNIMVLCWQCHRKHHDGKLKVKRINNWFFFKEKGT